MTITARYPGRCPRCERRIRPGQSIEWSRGEQPYHTACADQAGTPAAALPRDGRAIAGAAGGVRHQQGRNRRPDNCGYCGAHLHAGEGRLDYCVEDSGCRVHHDQGGYHVYCLDTDGCAARRAAARAERAAAVSAQQAWAEAVRRIEAAAGHALPRGEPAPQDAAEARYHVPTSYGASLYVCVCAARVILFRPRYDDDPVIHVADREPWMDDAIAAAAAARIIRPDVT